MQGRGSALSRGFVAAVYDCRIEAALGAHRDAATAIARQRVFVCKVGSARCRTARESGRGIVSHAPSFSRAAAFERSMVVSTVQAQVVNRSSVEFLHFFTRPGVPPFDHKIFFKKIFPPPADVRPRLIGSPSK